MITTYTFSSADKRQNVAIIIPATDVLTSTRPPVYHPTFTGKKGTDEPFSDLPPVCVR